MSFAWSPNGQKLASGSLDGSIRLSDPTNGQELAVLEGHTDPVRCVTFSPGGQVLASSSWDGSVRIWHAETGIPLAVLPQGVSRTANSGGLAFHPKQPIFASSGDDDTVIRIWRLDYVALFEGERAESARYTTAKIVLVGDSGVGKTGLGWRLAHGEYKEHSSTHGQQFWVIKQLSTTTADGTECEAVLWDLAGQPDYRLVHSLFLDEVDLALVLFDPTNRLEPLTGVDFWLNQLNQRDQSRCPCILVGSRTDRGTASLTEGELNKFCELNGISGGHIDTSAMTGHGLSELMIQIKLSRTRFPWTQNWLNRSVQGGPEHDR